MQARKVADVKLRSDFPAISRDIGAWLGFSAALAVAIGVVKTPMHLPGHSAILWLPVLVLAGWHRRPGMAVGSAMCGGVVAGLWGGVRGSEFAGLLASAAVVEAMGLWRAGRSTSLWLLLAGALGHLGKLGVKLLAAGLVAGPLNRAALPLLPTVALYLAFGLAGGAIAWGLWAAYAHVWPQRTRRAT